MFTPEAIAHVAREGPGTLGDRLYVGGATVIGLGSAYPLLFYSGRSRDTPV